ncbi:MAG TPA: TetR/AcrR family transcriptional regulator, partial [Bacillota bacterium]|nr:TetR/AcrR family transcriptional regulator [Bacillota bacterium]
VIRASIEEFAKGYEVASTNEIVRKAGISKGLLFHYFGSKKNLYMTVFREVVQRTTETLLSRAGELPGDVIERMLRLTLIKLELYREDPKGWHFLADAVSNPPHELKQEIRSVQAELTDFGMKAFLTGLDLAQLRPDVDAECLLRFVLLFLKGLEQEYLGRGDLSSLDWEQIIKEFMVYVELLRTGIGSQCGSDRDPHMG